MRTGSTAKALVLAVVAALAVGCPIAGPHEPGSSGGPSGPDAGGPDATSPDSAGPDTGKPDPAKPKKFSITKVEPDEGRTAGGELVVIEGQKFSDDIRVFFGQVEAPEVTVHSEVVIHVRTPPHKPGLTDITLAKQDGFEVVREGAFLFRDQISIAKVVPASAPAFGGTPITVEGDGFSAGTSVLIGGRLALDITVVDSRTILAISPPGKPGKHDVLVSSQWANTILRDGFRLTEAPVLVSLDPVTGPMDNQTVVTLVGSGFGSGAEVAFGGQPVQVLDGAGDTQIQVLLQGGPAGPADVVVSTTDGIAWLQSAFTFVDPGAVSGDLALLNVFPKAGDVAGGQKVILTAYGLTTAADTTVRFGAANAQVTVIDAAAGLVFAVSPAGKPGAVDVMVSSSAGESTLKSAYRYSKVPVLENAWPAGGSAEGGDTLAITGSNLDAEDMEVFVGALPAKILAQAPGKLEVRTPKGSPGAADLRAVTPAGKDVLAGAFTYLPKAGIELYAVSPNYGAIAGNTLVYVYGAGFGPTTKVRFAKKILQNVDVVSSTELRVRAPKADEPGAVDVTVEHAGKSVGLVDAYAYFDPYSPYGGSWGPAIHGTVNITVLDIYTTDPIPDAFVMLWDNPSTPFQGYTDDRGQLTFSDPMIQGPQMVTAAKPEYTAFSVVEYDAENVTVHLIPYNPSTPGGGGGGTAVAPGRIYGRVNGLGKYVVLPPVPCSAMVEKGKLGPGTGSNCLACTTASDCGPGYACVDIAGEGLHCAQKCTGAASCPEGWVCGGAGGGQVACVPDPGKKAAYCKTTNYALWREPIPAQNGQIGLDPAKAWAGADGQFWMNVHPGELALLCFGGVSRDTTTLVTAEATFIPQILGVARHIEVGAGQDILDVQVQLEIPLKKDVPLRLDGAPLEYTGSDGVTIPTQTHIRVAYDFGSEGYYTIVDQIGTAVAELTLARQPEQLVGDLDGVTYTFLVEVAGGAYAVSGTQAGKVKVLDVDRIFAFQDGAWAVVKAGIPRDIHAMWGTDPANLWAVGAGGLIAHGKNGAWFPQYSPASEGLNAVWGASETHAVAVGDNGTVVAFDGVTWKEEDAGTDAHLYGVFGTSPDNLYAVGQNVVLKRGTSGWTAFEEAPYTTLRAVWGTSAGSFLAVGDDGKLWIWDSGWSTQPLLSGSGIGLRAIHGTGPDDIYVVGDLGTVLHLGAGGEWEQEDVPVTEQLNAVHATGDGTVFVVGSRGTLLRYDGYGWTAESAPKYGGDLLAVWGFGAPEAKSYAAGTQVVSLGPMLAFPKIGDPVANVYGGTAFSYHVDWTFEPGASPTFNLVQLLIPNGGQPFPAWSTVLHAEVQDVTYPNLPEIEGIFPWPAGTSLLLQVTRVLKPGASVDNFDFWDTYGSEYGGWKSWSWDGLFVTP